jgi:ribonucleotide reductase alpha subunit
MNNKRPNFQDKKIEDKKEYLKIRSQNHEIILEFLNQNYEQIQWDRISTENINWSEKLIESFLNAVEENKEYEQYWPLDGEKQISQKIPARDIWMQIIECAWQNGEPGVMFWDAMINNSLSNRYGEINPSFFDKTTNPCFTGDQYLLTENGYDTFLNLYNKKVQNNILADNRISYNDNGVEKPENWKIDMDQSGIVNRSASEVFLTQKNEL